jgi:hypothetical protein
MCDRADYPIASSKAAWLGGKQQSTSHPLPQFASGSDGSISTSHHLNWIYFQGRQRFKSST